MKLSFAAPAIGFLLLTGCAAQKGVHHPGLSEDGYGYVKNGPTLPPPNGLVTHMSPQESQALKAAAHSTPVTPVPFIPGANALPAHNITPVPMAPVTPVQAAPRAAAPVPAPALSHPILPQKPRAPLHKKTVTAKPAPIKPVPTKPAPIKPVPAAPPAPVKSVEPTPAKPAPVQTAPVTTPTPVPPPPAKPAPQPPAPIKAAVKQAPVIDDNILPDGGILSANPLPKAKHRKRHK